MISRKLSLAGVLLALIMATAVPSWAVGINPFGKKKPKVTDLPARKLTPAQSALIDKAVLREKEVVKTVRERAPLVETYIQNMKPDAALIQLPESDQHFLGRVDFSQVINDDAYKAGPKPNTQGHSEGTLSMFKHSLSYVTGLSAALHLQFREYGFVQMILVDSRDFDRQHYNFGYVRTEFLGTVPTAVFDVTPVADKGFLKGDRTRGRFFGRIWVETRDGNIVRFNGDFAGSEATIAEYYHFDSWRTNVQPGLWLPTSVYMEEDDPKSTTNTLKFKAVSHVWGYALKVPTKEAESTSMDVVGATDISNDATDISPLGAQRKWVQQAEDNVVERLYQAGLLDAPSDFDKTLEALASNILVYNNISLPRPIRCRTLLTETLESMSFGNTIIVSKGLIDTTSTPGGKDGAQQLGNLYAILAFQVAHIILEHRPDTKFAFSDRLLFPDTSSFQRIPMHHTDADNTEAAKRALELLSVKPTDATGAPVAGSEDLATSQQYFGLYLEQLQQRMQALHSLTEPMIGDGLTKSDTDGTLWLQPIVAKGIKLNFNDLKQQAAMPLSNYLRFDPWTDQVVQMNTTAEALISPREKTPFEVTALYLKLGYYKPPADPAAVTTAPAASTAPAAPAPAAIPPTGATTPAPQAAPAQP